MALSRIAAPLLLATTLCAQVVPSDHTTHILGTDSGIVRNDVSAPDTLGIPRVVWSHMVTVPKSSWLRLEYEGVLLSGSADRGADGSFLRLTSMRDGAVQTQHLRHVGEWQDTSAYFNGDAVLVELLAHPRIRATTASSSGLCRSVPRPNPSRTRSAATTTTAC